MASLDLDTAYQIGIDAYEYLYPIVIMDITRRQLTNVVVVHPLTGRGPANMFVNVPVFPPADSRSVVRPNFDTLYSTAWLDLRKEPLVIEVPQAVPPPGGTEPRYYLLPMLDMWTDVFTSPGIRTTGSDAQKMVVVGPGWSGTINEALDLQRIDASTPDVWIIGRTQCSGTPADYDAVHQFQRGLKITPYSYYAAGKPAPTPVGSSSDDIGTDEPPQIVADMSPDEFFAYGAKLMMVQPAHFNDYPILAQLQRVGFVPGQPFDLSQASPVVQEAFRSAVPAALDQIRDKTRTLTAPQNGWTYPNEEMGTYATDYLRRAAIAMSGLGANLVKDAIYPNASVDGAGTDLDSSRNYTLVFAADQQPPVNAFWSVTLYDEAGYQVPNELNRFSLGTRNPLKTGPDGSITLYIQRDMAKTDPRLPNWLPSPKDQPVFNLTMRLYYPQPPAVNAEWVPPPVNLT